MQKLGGGGSYTPLYSLATYLRQSLTSACLLTVVYSRDGTGSVTLTRDPTRPGTPVTRDPD